MSEVFLSGREWKDQCACFLRGRKARPVSPAVLFFACFLRRRFWKGEKGDLFLLLFASSGSSAAREAEEIMMQINRKLEIICQLNYLPMKLSSNEIIFQWNYLPMMQINRKLEIICQYQPMLEVRGIIWILEFWKTDPASLVQFNSLDLTKNAPFLQILHWRISSEVEIP